MRKLTMAACAALMALSASAAWAEVKVNFVDPDSYRDANLYQRYGKNAKEPTLREIEQTFWKLGEFYLAPGEKLTIDVLDVDLAGRFEPWNFNYRDVRFMRDITWPSMKLRYTLESPYREGLSGEETVEDRSYLFDFTVRQSVATMAYEKVMLERWFRTRFAPRAE